MYYELYIDVLFLENLVLDYLLLRLLKWMLCCSSTWLRLLLAAVLGSGCMCALCISAFYWNASVRLLFTGAISMLMVKLGFPVLKFRQTVMASGLLFVLGFLLGGIMEWLLGMFSGTVDAIVILSIPAYGILKAALKILIAGKRKREVLCRVCVAYKGVVRKTTGLLDTGNGLYDPYYHKPVSIVERKILEPQILEEELIFQIPYHSVGNTDGIMSAVFVDYVSIRLGDQTYVIDRPILGFTEESLSGDGSYNLILHPNLADR